MWRPSECNHYWNEIKRKIADNPEDVNLTELEHLYDRAIEAAMNYGKQMALKNARAKGPYGAWA